MSIEAACHCKSVRLVVAHIPAELTDCNCSICRRYGSLWAYYSPDDVEVVGAPVQHYKWDDRSIRFERCGRCGCVTHWSANDKAVNRMGINARMFEPSVIKDVHVRHLDGATTEEYVD